MFLKREHGKTGFCLVKKAKPSADLLATVLGELGELEVYHF
jgi:hypothetical protein